MELSLRSTSLFAALLLTGLSAGLFYAWSVSVIPGTRRISDASYLETMQHINRAILNPAFFLIFFGSLITLLLATYSELRNGWSLAGALWLFAFIAYAAGTFGVTAAGNVPLNEALDKIDLNTITSEAANQWRLSYETDWNRWHLIRTIFAVISFILGVLGSMLKQLPDTIA